MAYDVNEQVLLDAINSSALPDAAKAVIDALLNTGDPSSPKQIAILSDGDVPTGDTDIAEINASGVYSASGTPIIIVNSNEAVQLTYTVGGSTYVILAGSDDDIIIIQDGVQLRQGREVGDDPDSLGGLIRGFEGDDSISGGSGNDSISGDAGLDTITGGAGDDTISGGSNVDNVASAPAGSVMFGENGEVILTPDQPIELLDGGAGVDTVILSGNQSSYTLLISPDGTTIVDRRPGGEGVDQLMNMEFLDFDTELDVFGGEPMDLRVFGGASIESDDFESIIELYVAYFNRAPDAVGLFFWANAFSNGVSLDEMAELFAQQPETLAAFPEGTTNAEIVSIVYDNVLGRSPDAAGEEFWTGVLDSGAVSADQFILEVLRGAKAEPPEGASASFVIQQLRDQEMLSDKTDIGAYFAVHRGMSDVENASAVMALVDGSSAGVDAAIAAADQFYADALDPFDGEFLMPLVGVLENPFNES